jgi:hypothetical protein
MTDPATGLPQPAADEALLKQLTEALGPLPRTPPPASVAVLRRSVEEKWKPTARARVRRRLAAWARRLQRTGAAVAVFGGVAVGDTGMALAAGGSVHHQAQYWLHYPEIPALTRADHHDGAQRPVRPSGNAGFQALPRPLPTTPSTPGAKPLLHTDTSRVLVAPSPPGRGSSVSDTTAPNPWSAPATYRDPPSRGRAVDVAHRSDHG